jgi:hypothetical protein
MLWCSILNLWDQKITCWEQALWWGCNLEVICEKIKRMDFRIVSRNTWSKPNWMRFSLVSWKQKFCLYFLSENSSNADVGKNCFMFQVYFLMERFVWVSLRFGDKPNQIEQQNQLRSINGIRLRLKNCYQNEVQLKISSSLRFPGTFYEKCENLLKLTLFDRSFTLQLRSIIKFRCLKNVSNASVCVFLLERNCSPEKRINSLKYPTILSIQTQCLNPSYLKPRSEVKSMYRTQLQLDSTQ